MINEIKSCFGGKTIFIFLLLIASVTAQQFNVIEVKGDVKYQSGISEDWIDVHTGDILQLNGFLATGKNSTLKINQAEEVITIGELSAVSISSIKKMSTDELLLALAMQDMINAPKTNGKGNSSSTATYGNKESIEKTTQLKTIDFGIKRLNGAMQLADNGLKESSVVFAEETYRKYPETKSIASYRIFFADVLYEKGLYEEALGDYLEIQKLDLSDQQNADVDSKIESINKIMLNN